MWDFWGNVLGGMVLGFPGSIWNSRNQTKDGGLNQELLSCSIAPPTLTFRHMQIWAFVWFCVANTMKLLVSKKLEEEGSEGVAVWSRYFSPSPCTWGGSRWSHPYPLPPPILLPKRRLGSAQTTGRRPWGQIKRSGETENDAKNMRYYAKKNNIFLTWSQIDRTRSESNR